MRIFDVQNEKHQIPSPLGHGRGQKLRFSMFKIRNTASPSHPLSTKSACLRHYSEKTFHPLSTKTSLLFHYFQNSSHFPKDSFRK